MSNLLLPADFQSHKRAGCSLQGDEWGLIEIRDEIQRERDHYSHLPRGQRERGRSISRNIRFKWAEHLSACNVYICLFGYLFISVCLRSTSASCWHSASCLQGNRIHEPQIAPLSRSIPSLCTGPYQTTSRPFTFHIPPQQQIDPSNEKNSPWSDLSKDQRVALTGKIATDWIHLASTSSSKHIGEAAKLKKAAVETWRTLCEWICSLCRYSLKVIIHEWKHSKFHLC